MPHILIAESLDMETLQTAAREQGWQVHLNVPTPDDDGQGDWHFSYQPHIMPDVLKMELGRYDALVVRPKEAKGEAIRAAMPRLKIIVRGGAGINSIDLEAAAECGVIVENTPGQNSVSTAEFTFALIMELAANRQIQRSASDTLRGDPDAPEHYLGRELEGQKIGIIGLGAIGQAVARRAAAFDMEVFSYSRTKKDVPYRQFDSLNALLDAGPDIICLHAPYTPQTEKMLDKAAYNLMKKSTILINTARPQLMDAAALKYALSKGIISRFAIDGDMDLVEPFIKIDQHRKGIITHHIADATKQAQAKITRQVLAQLVAFFREGKVVNRVG